MSEKMALKLEEGREPVPVVGGAVKVVPLSKEYCRWAVRFGGGN